MKKKIIISGITVVFLLISGICYSFAYQKKEDAVLISADVTENESKVEEIQSTELSAMNTGNTSDSSEADSNSSDTTQTSLEASDVLLADSQSQEKLTYIYVHVCGAVVTPGVYRAEEGARLIDLIQLAGGLTQGAAGDYINQAQPVTDGQRIYIPDKEELQDLTVEDYIAGDQINSSSNSVAEESADALDSSLIDINTADKEELMSISGIGEAKAASILAYREKNGKFNSIEELMNIPGIKEGLFNQISYMIVAN